MLNEKDKCLIETLKSGGLAVMPTDTIYGLVASAFSKKAVERVYEIKDREKDKPFIILISNIKDLDLFGIKISDFQRAFLRRNWPGALSIIFDCPKVKWHYLHRGTKSLAFRLPDNEWLREIVKKTGPLAAPSANPSGFPPASNLTEAKKYFATKVDYYYAGRLSKGLPSTLIKFDQEDFTILRQGKIVPK